MENNDIKKVTEGTWNQLKGKIQKNWGKLTDDKLTQTEGREVETIGKLQKGTIKLTWFGRKKACIPRFRRKESLEQFHPKI